MSSGDQVALIARRMTQVIALIVTILLPLGYWVITFSNLSVELQFKAKVKATSFSSLINSNPGLWIYAENQMQGRLTREPVALETELVQVYDVEGVLITQAGQIPAPPKLSRRYPLYDGVGVVGQIEVSDSLRGLIYSTVVVSAFGLLLGASILVFMWAFPLRALQQTLQALVDSEFRFHTLVDLLPYGVQENDLTGCVTFVNPAIEHMYCQRKESITGRFIWDFLAEDLERESLRDYLQFLIREQPPLTPYFSKVRHLDGSVIDVQIDWAYDRNKHGQVKGFITIISDITERKQMQEALQEQATHDPLTGLFNRRALNETLLHELYRSQRSGEPLTVAMLDLDHFKQFNDTYGHEAGDLVLQAVSELLRCSLRASDIACRYGGEEFTVVMPGSSLDNARNRLDEVRQAIGHLRLRYQNDELPPITVSIGIAELIDQETDSATLLGRADAALYQAKEQGRNQIVVATILRNYKIDPGISLS